MARGLFAVAHFFCTGGPGNFTAKALGIINRVYERRQVSHDYGNFIR